VRPRRGATSRIRPPRGHRPQRDIGALLWGTVFEPLGTEDALFEQVTVRAGTVAWPRDADLDPDVLIWGGPAPRDSGRRPPRVLRLERTPARV
jgi:hypothetical protein